MKHINENIVVTGMGALTPLGGSITQILKNLKNGNSGITGISKPHMKYLPVKHAGIVKKDYFLDDPSILEWKKEKNWLMQLALYSGQQAFKSAKLDNFYQSQRIGCYLGGDPPSPDITRQLSLFNSIIKDGKFNISKFNNIEIEGLDVLDMGLFPQVILSKMSNYLGFNGPAFFHLGTCAAAAQAAGAGRNLLLSGDVDVMLVGGISSKIDPFSISRLGQIQALELTKGKDPSKLCRPFDIKRSGFTMSEGSVFFVLEREKEARKRNANILAKFGGCGMALDGYSITDPHPDSLGMIMSMQRAINDAGINLDEIDYLNAHGTSTRKNDFYETNAIKTIFKDSAYELDISSTKSMHGHLMSAAGAMEMLVSILAIQNEFVPPTINFENFDPECDLNYNFNKGKKKIIKNVLSNSFGLGGQNCSLALSKYEK